MKYEHTYLSVRVTATGNTAREMSRWSDAARTEYLRDQIVMFLNGRRPDFCVECVDLESERLERRQVCAHTDGDLLGMADSLDALDEPEHAKECRKIVSDRKGSARRGKELLERIKPTPTPAPQAGEWPKWAREKQGCRVWQLTSELPGGGRYAGFCYSQKGRVEDHLPYGFNVKSFRDDEWVTPTQAAKWLRANGHAKVADELEGEGRGEWPRWTKYRTRVIRYDADTSGVEYHPFIAPFRNVSAVFGFAARTECGSELEITEAEALSWLRSNGNEAEAAKLEGDRFEPVGVAARAGDIVECVHASTYARNYKVGDKWELISTSSSAQAATKPPRRKGVPSWGGAP